MTMETSSLAQIEDGIVDEVVTGALALLVEDGTCSVSAPKPPRANDFTVAVYCDSQQQSAVVLRCSHAFALLLTENMLELKADDIQDGDVLDATGELVNIIAGNLRGLVESPGTMTPPFLVEQQAYEQFPLTAVNSYDFSGQAIQVLRV